MKLIGTKEFYKSVFHIAIPIMIQNVVTNSVSLVNNITVSNLGTESLAGVAIANSLISIYYLCIFGTISATGIFGAQYAGRKDYLGERFIFRLMITLSIVFSFLDPANLAMVTADDPVKAVYTLRDYIVHTHAKDGVNLKACDRHKIYGFFATGGDGGDLRDMPIWEYFKEVPLGQGSVDFDAYLAALADIGYKGYLTIEREVGADPAADIGLAVNFLKEKTAKYEI